LFFISLFLVLLSRAALSNNKRSVAPYTTSSNDGPENYLEIKMQQTAHANTREAVIQSCIS
jgi:hypothetical protein